MLVVVRYRGPNAESHPDRIRYHECMRVTKLDVYVSFPGRKSVGVITTTQITSDNQAGGFIMHIRKQLYTNVAGEDEHQEGSNVEMTTKSKTVRILVVDDEQDIADLYAMWLEAEYETTVGARSLPAGFRRVVLAAYERRCPVSGVDHERLLDVAHVLSWSDYPGRRTDPQNVLALDRTHHAAFDAGLFTLSSDYRVHVEPGFETDSDVLAGTLLERDGACLPWAERAPDISDALARRNRGLEWDVPA